MLAIVKIFMGNKATKNSILMLFAISGMILVYGFMSEDRMRQRNAVPTHISGSGPIIQKFSAQHR